MNVILKVEVRGPVVSGGSGRAWGRLLQLPADGPHAELWSTSVECWGVATAGDENRVANLAGWPSVEHMESADGRRQRVLDAMSCLRQVMFNLDMAQAQTMVTAAALAYALHRGWSIVEQRLDSRVVSS